MAGTKKPVFHRLFAHFARCLHVAYVLIKAALVTGCLVGVNQTLACSMIDNRHGLFICLPGSVTITGGNQGNYLFDRCAHI